MHYNHTIRITANLTNTRVLRAGHKRVCGPAISCATPRKHSMCVMQLARRPPEARTGLPLVINSFACGRGHVRKFVLKNNDKYADNHISFVTYKLQDLSIPSSYHFDR